MARLPPHVRRGVGFALGTAFVLKVLQEQLSTINSQSSTSLSGRILKWPTRADCKSAGLRLRRFESFSYHHLKTLGKTPLFSNVYRAYIATSGFRLLLFSALTVSCRLFQNGAQKATIKLPSNFQVSGGFYPRPLSKRPTEGTQARNRGILARHGHRATGFTTGLHRGARSTGRENARSRCPAAPDGPRPGDRA